MRSCHYSSHLLSTSPDLDGGSPFYACSKHHFSLLSHRKCHHPLGKANVVIIGKRITVSVSFSSFLARASKARDSGKTSPCPLLHLFGLGSISVLNLVQCNNIFTEHNQFEILLHLHTINLFMKMQMVCVIILFVLALGVGLRL